MCETDTVLNNEKNDLLVILIFYSALHELWVHFYPDALSSQADTMDFSELLVNLQGAFEEIAMSVPELSQETYHAMKADYQRIVDLVHQYPDMSLEQKQEFLLRYREEENYLRKLVRDYFDSIREASKTPSI